MSEQPYTLGQWRGITTYRCTRCAFDCMDEAQALEHYASHTAKPQEPQPEPRTLALAVDDSGHVVVTRRPEPARRKPRKKKE
jgi:hypothetical protein